jgi:hypothetical protein
MWATSLLAIKQMPQCDVSASSVIQVNSVTLWFAILCVLFEIMLGLTLNTVVIYGYT